MWLNWRDAMFDSVIVFLIKDWDKSVNGEVLFVRFFGLIFAYPLSLNTCQASSPARLKYTGLTLIGYVHQ